MYTVRTSDCMLKSIHSAIGTSASMAPRHVCQRAVSETHEYDAIKQQLKVRGQINDISAGLTYTTILRTQLLSFLASCKPSFK